MKKQAKIKQQSINDDVDGGNGNDTVSGGEGDDVVDGGAGDDSVSGVEVIHRNESDDAPNEDSIDTLTIVADAPRKDLTFEEVMAWNRANPDKLPPPPVLPPKVRPKLTRF